MESKYSGKALALHLIKLSVISAPFCCIAAHAEHSDKFDFLLAEANHQFNSFHDQQTHRRFTDWENLIYHSLDKTESENLWLSDNKLIRLNDDTTLNHWTNMMNRIEKEQG